MWKCSDHNENAALERSAAFLRALAAVIGAALVGFGVLGVVFSGIFVALGILVFVLHG